MSKPIATPDVSPDNYPLVTRIYLTRGDQESTYYNLMTQGQTSRKYIYSNRRVGIEILGRIHWLDIRVTRLSELKDIFIAQKYVDDSIIRNNYLLKIGIDSSGRWRNLRAPYCYLDARATILQIADKQVFDENSHYMNKTLKAHRDRLEWRLSELVTKYYT